MACARAKSVPVPSSWALQWAICLSLNLLWTSSFTQAAIYHYKGACVHTDEVILPGQTFFKGCHRCYCHDTGFVCFSPQKPTSWPEKCKRIATECGYTVVYRENPEVECRAYSWIG
ncbi:hypothetical protein AAFF_G00394050 [Aldrovandia affinis]|uniref:Uncharacterized protein n=1 Tax=Aldrovandia affinis TaxID=143900 RepID=A0AAD7SDK4_9TELE|nr:hypothetical protein AAFF_G00394050 [Aldrovandia affinis]